MRCRKWCLSLAVAGVAMAQANDPLLIKLCVGCHEIDLVVARRHTRQEWDGVVQDMIARGSKGADEELAFVAEYLSKYLGKVSVNTAAAKEIQDGLKISDKDAALIVAWREQHGKFKNFEEVRKVPGLDSAKLGDKRGWVSFE